MGAYCMNDIFKVTRMSNGNGNSNLMLITEEAIPDIFIGSALLVPYVAGYKDPSYVQVLLDQDGKPAVTKLRTCVVIQYIYR